MYETPAIIGNSSKVTTAIIDTEYGKALMISRSGLENYLFNWNEVPGKDTNRFVRWLEGEGRVQRGEELDITKTDNGTTITVLGSITPSGRNNLIFQLNETGLLESYSISDIEINWWVELGNNLFNWSEVPGKDTNRFVRWLESEGHIQPGEKLDISKTDYGRAITVSGRGTWIYRLFENGNGEFITFHGVKKNIKQEQMGWLLLFAKEENGNLNIYSGNNEIYMNESHEKQTPDDFFRMFSISMSNYTYPDQFIDKPYIEYDSKIYAWVYSDREIEKFGFYFSLDPRNSLSGISMDIMTDEGRVHLKKGWQVVGISVSLAMP